MKDYLGVTDNDWSNMGTRRNAQGSQGLMKQISGNLVEQPDSEHEGTGNHFLFVGN